MSFATGLGLFIIGTVVSMIVMFIILKCMREESDNDNNRSR